MALIKSDGATTIVEYPYTLSKANKDYPNVTFKQGIQGDDPELAARNIFPVVVLGQPVFDPATQKAVPDSVPTNNGGTWEIDWTVQPLTDEEKRQISDEIYGGVVNTNRATVRGMDDDRLRDFIGIFYTEAKAYEADNAVATPAIQAVATQWGVTRGAAVTRVIAKYGNYIGDSGTAFAVREDELDALP